MQIHLRLGVKDADIIYWKNSLPKSCFCMYVKEILAAEKNKKIAAVPVPAVPGFDRQKVDYKLIIQDKALIQYVKNFPEWKRSTTIKQIVKKHLKANYGDSWLKDSTEEKELSALASDAVKEAVATVKAESTAAHDPEIIDDSLDGVEDIPQDSVFDDDDDDDDMSEEYRRMLREMSGS